MPQDTKGGSIESTEDATLAVWDQLPRQGAHAQNIAGAKTVLHPTTACTLLLAIANFFLSLVVV